MQPQATLDCSASANIREEDARHLSISISLHGTNIIKEGSRRDFFSVDVRRNAPRVIECEFFINH